MAKLPVINIVDVNNLLYIGNHRFGNYSISDIAGNKIKTGGMYMVLSLLRRKIYSPTGNLWIFCFDRQSHRRELGLSLGVDYKTGRSKMPEHLMVQSEELFNWLPKIGYNTFGIDGLEADDIINTLVNSYKSMPVKINILSTDRDLSFNVSERCDLVSSNMKVPTVTLDNYSSTVGKKGHYVEYNSVLLYKVICGDSSDGIPPICKESYAIYRRVCNELIKIGFDLSTLIQPEVLEKCLGILSLDLQEKAMVNWELVKPFLLPEDAIQLTPQVINHEALTEFCSIFSMKSIAKKFGIELPETSKEVIDYRLGVYKRTVEKTDNATYSEETKSDGIYDEKLIGVDRIKLIDSILEDLNYSALKNVTEGSNETINNEEVNQSITEDINQ